MKPDRLQGALERLTGPEATDVISDALRDLAVASIIGAVVLVFSIHAKWDVATLARAVPLAIIAVVFLVWSILLETKGGAK